MILIPKNPVTKGYLIGHWPLPEDFWLNLNAANLVSKLNYMLTYFFNKKIGP
jgi:hypothetical protein